MKNIKNQIIRTFSDEGTLWFSCDYYSDEKKYCNFNSNGITFLDGLIGIKSKISYEEGEEITVELVNEYIELDLHDKDNSNFDFLGTIQMESDKRGLLKVGWLTTLDDDEELIIPKKKTISISFWVNKNKDYIKVFVK